MLHDFFIESCRIVMTLREKVVMLLWLRSYTQLSYARLPSWELATIIPSIPHPFHKWSSVHSPWVYPSPKIFKKYYGLCEKRERIKKHSPSLKIIRKERRENHAKRIPSSIHHIHTHAHLDQVVWLVAPKDLVFDSTIHEKQVCHMFSLPTAPHISLLGVGCERRQPNALVRKHTH
jgi:hypothetical protein